MTLVVILLNTLFSSGPVAHSLFPLFEAVLKEHAFTDHLFLSVSTLK